MKLRPRFLVGPLLAVFVGLPDPSAIGATFRFTSTNHIVGTRGPSLTRPEFAKVLRRESPGLLAGDARRVADSFASGILPLDVEEPVSVLRLAGSGARPRGHFVFDSYRQLENTKNRLALPPENGATHLYEYEIPAGQRIYVGRTRKAFGRRGGGTQIYVPKAETLMLKNAWARIADPLSSDLLVNTPMAGVKPSEKATTPAMKIKDERRRGLKSIRSAAVGSAPATPVR